MWARSARSHRCRAGGCPDGHLGSKVGRAGGMPAAERGVAPGGVWDLLSGEARSVGYGGTLIHTHTADDPGSEGSVAPLHVNEREHKRGGKEGGESSALASRRCVDEIDRLSARAWAPSIPVTSPHSVSPREEKTQWTLPRLRLLGTPLRYLHGGSRSIDIDRGAPGVEREIEILSTMCSRGGYTGRADRFSGLCFWAVLQGRSRSLSGSRSKRRNPNRIRWTVDGGRWRRRHGQADRACRDMGACSED